MSTNLRLSRCLQLGLGLLPLALQMVDGLTNFRLALRLLADGLLQGVQYRLGMVGHPADVPLEQLVQLVNPDLVGGTGFPASAKVCAADVLRGQLRPRAGEERTAAVSTEEIATVRCGILFLPAVMASAALAEQFLGIGEGVGFNDGSVGVFKHQLFFPIDLLIRAVDAGTAIFLLPESTNIKVVEEDPLDRGQAPGLAGGALSGLPQRFLLGDLVGTRGGDSLICEVVGDLLIAPAVVVQAKDFPHNLCGRGVNFIGHLLGIGDAVAIGDGTDPFALLLTVGNDLLDLAAGVGDGELIHEKLELNQHPLVFCRVVNGIPYRDDAHMGIPQGLQFE